MILNRVQIMVRECDMMFRFMQFAMVYGFWRIVGFKGVGKVLSAMKPVSSVRLDFLM